MVNSLERRYAEALRQFTTGRVGWSSLCIFISPLMEGAEGFIFRVFPLAVFRYECLALFHRVSNFGLESVCKVCGDCVEVYRSN